MDFDVSGSQQRVDLLLKKLTRKPVGRDPVTQHSAEVLALFKYLDAVSHEREEVSRRDTAWASADYCDFFPGCWRSFLAVFEHRDVSGVFDRVEFQPANVQSVVDHCAAAFILAGVFADHGAD